MDGHGLGPPRLRRGPLTQRRVDPRSLLRLPRLSGGCRWPPGVVVSRGLRGAEGWGCGRVALSPLAARVAPLGPGARGLGDGLEERVRGVASPRPPGGAAHARDLSGHALPTAALRWERGLGGLSLRSRPLLPQPLPLRASRRVCLPALPLGGWRARGGASGVGRGAWARWEGRCLREDVGSIGRGLGRLRAEDPLPSRGPDRPVRRGDLGALRGGGRGFGGERRLRWGPIAVVRGLGGSLRLAHTGPRPRPILLRGQCAGGLAEIARVTGREKVVAGLCNLTAELQPAISAIAA
mmetsp:Transcript_14436/g.41514  ORF Transcript_14436/g.41514 Transcript_14436/m.41514 type:complete len:295 (-) Transcript_14436:271-1155(-)